MRRGLRRDGFAEQSHTRARGEAGEEDGVLWLREEGYRIVERNFVAKTGEIDVIAWDGETLCFVEIKARATTSYGPAVEAVSFQKQRRIARTAALYLARKPTDAPCRFDVLGMDQGANGWNYSLLRDAFTL